jgi:hypothetical protein
MFSHPPNLKIDFGFIICTSSDTISRTRQPQPTRWPAPPARMDRTAACLRTSSSLKVHRPCTMTTHSTVMTAPRSPSRRNARSQPTMALAPVNPQVPDPRCLAALAQPSRTRTMARILALKWSQLWGMLRLPARLVARALRRPPRRPRALRLRRQGAAEAIRPARHRAPRLAVRSAARRRARVSAQEVCP